MATVTCYRLLSSSSALYLIMRDIEKDTTRDYTDFSIPFTNERILQDGKLTISRITFTADVLIASNNPYTTLASFETAEQAIHSAVPPVSFQGGTYNTSTAVFTSDTSLAYSSTICLLINLKYRQSDSTPSKITVSGVLEIGTQIYT